MTDTHRKHLTPKRYAERTPPNKEGRARYIKPTKQRRVNERAALRKEWR